MRLLVAGITGQLGAGLVEACDPELVELVPLARPLATRSAPIVERDGNAVLDG